MTRPTRMTMCAGGCDPKCGQCGVAIEIELTDIEIAEMNARAEMFAAKEAEREAEVARIASVKESAKAKLIAGVPLTEEEASVLVI